MARRHDIEEYKGQIKDIKNPYKISDFVYNDSKLLLAHKKTERLSEAVYMVTELFDDKEPLKWELRAKTVSLMSFINEFSSGADAYDSYSLHRCLQGVLSEVLSPLELAVHTRLISPMNFSILRDEFTSLGEILESHSAELYARNDVSFPDNFFSYAKNDSEDEKRKEAIKDTKSTEKTSEQKQVEKQKDKSSVKDIKDIKDTRTFHKKDTEAKSGRREAIIQLLKTKGELTIKEIASVVDGWSEKTIQRELMSLINESVIQKKGERRWSTYLLLEQ